MDESTREIETYEPGGASEAEYDSQSAQSAIEREAAAEAERRAEQAAFDNAQATTPDPAPVSTGG